MRTKWLFALVLGCLYLTNPLDASAQGYCGDAYCDPSIGEDEWSWPGDCGTAGDRSGGMGALLLAGLLTLAGVRLRGRRSS